MRQTNQELGKNWMEWKNEKGDTRHREERKQRWKLKTVSFLGEVTRVNNSEVIVKDRDRNIPDQNKIFKTWNFAYAYLKTCQQQEIPNKNSNFKDK